MGCEHSANSDQTLYPMDGNFRPKLGKADVHVILVTWDHIGTSMQGLGYDIIYKAMEEKPEIKQFFEQYLMSKSNADDPDLGKEAEEYDFLIRSHGSGFVKLLDRLVVLLREEDVTKVHEALHELGLFHREIHIHKEWLPIFAAYLLGTLRMVGQKENFWNGHTELAWNNFIALIAYYIKTYG